MTRYGYDSLYPAVVRIPYWLYGPETKVPTRYDQTNFVWTHNLGDGDEIKATIEYNGEVADLEVTIPWIGYSMVKSAIYDLDPGATDFLYSESGLRHGW